MPEKGFKSVLWQNCKRYNLACRLNRSKWQSSSVKSPQMLYGINGKCVIKCAKFIGLHDNAILNRDLNHWTICGCFVQFTVRVYLVTIPPPGHYPPCLAIKIAISFLLRPHLLLTLRWIQAKIKRVAERKLQAAMDKVQFSNVGGRNLTDDDDDDAYVKQVMVSGAAFQSVQSVSPVSLINHSISKSVT